MDSAQTARLSEHELLFRPNISLNGSITADTLNFFLDRLQQVRNGSQDLVLEINTEGGDADIARRVAMEVRLFLRHSGRRGYCIGKTNVYSAGVTILAAFPRATRFLTEDCVLLIHERRLDTQITLCGPIRSSIQIVREQLALLETAERLEMEGFRDLVTGSSVTVEELYERAKNNCYLHAPEALELGLVGAIIGEVQS
jgi:ATP-dependent protease ClpP protease subunit